MTRSDPYAQLTCSFRRKPPVMDCTRRPTWRIVERITRDYRELVAAGRGPWAQQYACDGHLEAVVAGIGETAVYEPLDDHTTFGAGLLESRIPGQALSERENWVRTRAAHLRRLHISDPYLHAALEWFAGHPEDES